MSGDPLDALAGLDTLDALARLDSLLAGGIAAAEAAYGAEARGDRFRGLRIDLAEVERLLAREPAAPILTAAVPAGRAVASGGLQAIAADAELSAFDLDVVVIGLAPELDLRYERLFAYLQDDVTKKRPTVDLALHLLCASAAERLAGRARFHPDAPLSRGGVLRLLPEPAGGSPLLARAFALQAQVVTRLIGGGLDPRLAGFCTLASPGEEAAGRGLPLPAGLDGLADALAKAATTKRTLRVYLRGQPGIGRQRVVEAAAARAGKRLLTVDLATAAPELIGVALREAEVHDAICVVRGLEPGPDMSAFARALHAGRGVVAVVGSGPWPSMPVLDRPLGVHVVTCPVPGSAYRRTVWRLALDAAAVRLGDDELDALAGRFRLTQAQIAEAAATVRPPVPDDLVCDVDATFAAARAQTGQDLAAVATKIEPVYGWDDLIVSEDAGLALREICQRVAHQDRVLYEWDFAGKLSLGRGVAALFAGPPGTGKTMAAEVVARELRLDLFRIDLASVISKWIGETEKNLDRVFAAAESANAILFFDEADALFGKRGEVQDSHDRYANIEVSYLLQKMESYEGIAILATNRIDDLDEAFLRRIAFVVRFPFPEPAERLRIWTGVWPKAVPLAGDIDWDRLATTMSLNGAEIKNVALAAAFLAAEDGTDVSTRHILHAARREHEKSGRAVSWPVPPPDADR